MIRLSKTKAILALVYTLPATIFQKKTISQCYRELDPTYRDDRERPQIVSQMVRRLKNLGYRIIVELADPVITV